MFNVRQAIASYLTTNATISGIDVYYADRDGNYFSTQEIINGLGTSSFVFPSGAVIVGDILQNVSIYTKGIDRVESDVDLILISKINSSRTNCELLAGNLKNELYFTNLGENEVSETYVTRINPSVKRDNDYYYKILNLKVISFDGVEQVCPIFTISGGFNTPQPGSPSKRLDIAITYNGYNLSFYKIILDDTIILQTTNNPTASTYTYTFSTDDYTTGTYSLIVWGFSTNKRYNISNTVTFSGTGGA